MRLSVGIFGLLTAFQAQCWANGGSGGGSSVEASAHRLPDDTVPESYALAVDPSDARSANGSFEGRVEIRFRVATTAATVTLNALDLDLREIRLVDVAADRSVGLRYWEYAPAPREQVTIHVDGHVFAGRKYVVRIRFVGRPRDDATGFFRTLYGSSEKKWLLATQFKMKKARSAFPCYDEPRYRTPFNISIKINNDEIALSNMPTLNTVNTNATGSQNSTWIHFMQTPAIPTFLVSYFVGEFESLNKDQPSSINVYSHLGNLYQIEYINRDMSSLLEVIKNYTGVKYALPKLDLLALPELSLDAVEQWGLNTYREKSLFVDKNTKTETKMMVKMLVERVMAQQWFTGLVNPSRWDSAWIIEGFATYFEYFGTATLEPDWRLEHFFIVKELQWALEHEQTSIYYSNDVQNTNEENYGIVDKTSRKKGAAILRMLNDWVGEEVFKRALNIFLTKNQYTAVEPEQLWNAFDNALFELTKHNLHGKSVHNIMNTWTEQVGYPVVNVAKEDKSFVLTQKRFSVRPSNVNDTTKWFIRLTYTNNKMMEFDSKLAQSIWMEPDTSETTVPVDNDAKWYIFNVQSLGYYRVNYTEENWASMTEQLETSPADIAVTSRAQLIDDSFNLARAGQLNYTVPLRLTRYLDKEDDIIPWFTVMDNLNFVLNQMRRSEEGYPDVKAFVRKIAGVAFQKMNKAIKTSQNNIHYPNNIGWNAFSKWACELDDNNCVTMALNYFRRWKNGEDIPADFQDAAFCTGIRHSTDDEDWPKMMELYRNTKTYSEKESALNALTCTENVRLLITNLVRILTKECSIEPRDYEAFFHALSLRPSGIAALTFFLQYHFTHILQNVTNGERMVTTIYSTLASRVSTDYETSKMSEIAYVSPSPFNLRDPSSPFADHYDGIETNRKWFDVHSTTIREFVNPGSTTAIPETTPSVTTQKTPEHDASASSRLESRGVILLQVLALSVSVKLLARIG